MRDDRMFELAGRSVPFQRRFLERLGAAAHRLVGATFPANWEDMRPPKVSNCLTEPGRALAWVVAKLASVGEKVRAAITRQTEIEACLMAGRMRDREPLEEFEAVWGRSLWSLDLRFAVGQFHRGFHGNRTELVAFQNGCSSEWVTFLSAHSSFRAQLNVSTAEFDEVVRLYFPPGDDQGAEYLADSLGYRFAGKIPDTPSGFCNVLHFEARHSAIDLHATAVDLLSRRLADDDWRLARAATDLFGVSSDPRVANMASVLSGEPRNAIDNRLCECVDLLARRDYDGCRRRAAEALAESPTWFVWYDLTTVAAARSGDAECPRVFDDGSPAQLVIASLFDWYSARTSRRQSIEELRRLARGLRPTRLGPALREFVAAYDENKTPLGRDSVNPLASPALLPQFALAIADPGRAHSYLAGVKGEFSGRACAGFLEAYHRLLDGDTAVDFDGLPEPERLRYEAAAAYVRKDHQSVVGTLRKLRSLDSASAVAYPELLMCEAEALLDMGELASAATNLAGLFCKDRRLLPPVLLRRVATLLKDKKFAPSQHNVGWPILAAAAYKDDRQQIDLDRVHDFVGDYIEAQGATRASELLAEQQNPPVELLVFLKECCTPDILESSIWFKSVEELLEERLSLCQELMDHFGDNDADLPKEIAALTRQLGILDLTSQIQRSRIFIDTEAILRNIDELTVEHTTSLLTFRALLGNELKRGLKLLGLPNADTGRVRLLVVDESVVFFEKVLERIKGRFLYSPELGLDANLSQRIRHGTLAGELRATFDRLHLSTKMQADDNYEPNTHWVDALHAWDPENAEAINYAFRTFSAGLDAWIRKVREEWVQIRSNEKPDGLFDYAFTQEEVERWVARISPLAEHADVHELVIGALLERTERCLGAVRTAIAGPLRESLEALLDALLAAVERVAARGYMPVANLRNVVTQCKTDLGRQLGKIQEWFYVENRHEQKRFRLRDLVETVEQVLNRINTPCRVSLVEEGDGGSTIPGARFRSLWDLFLILFDNASRHSGIERVPIKLRTNFGVGATSIICSNGMREGSDLTALGHKAEQLNRLSLENQSDLNKLREEGGSGTAKLHKIVRHELGSDHHDYRISIAVSPDSEFQVEIFLGMGLCDANTPH